MWSMGISFLEYRNISWLCSIRLIQVYKEIHKMVENDEIIGVSLPPLEDINKGSCKRTFGMLIDKS